MRLLGKVLFSNLLLGLALTLLILLAELAGCPPLKKLDLFIYDQLTTLRKAKPSEALMLVSIDLKTRQQIADTPWSRSQLAELVRKIKEQNPAALGLVTPLSFASADKGADRALADQADGLVLQLEGMPGLATRKSRYLEQNSVPQTVQKPTPNELLLQLHNPLLTLLRQPETELLIPPLPALQQKTRAGHLRPVPASDGLPRRMRLLLPWRDRLIPALPLQLILSARGEDLRDIGYGPTEIPGELRLGNLTLTLGPHYELLLDRSGSHVPLQTISGSDLLQGKVPATTLRNRIVLVGEAAPQYGSRHPGPLEIAGISTLSILNGAPLYQPAWAWLLETLALLYFAILCFLLLPRLSLRAGLLTLLLFLLTWLVAAAASLILTGAWFQVAPVLILSLSGFLLVQFNRQRRDLSSSKAESDKMLGQTFQEQGLLDRALEYYLRCPPDHPGIKPLIYNLGLDFERKRMPQKALSVYQHLQKAGRYKDLKERIQQLKKMDQTVIFGAGNGTMVISQGGEKPTLGRYRVEKELGQGAMGTVYLGVDPKINRPVAIKTLSYNQVDPEELPDIKARFFREAEAAGRLSHPHIVTIHDVGEENDLAYMAMELLDGKDLSAYCNEKDRLEVSEILEVGLQIAEALEYAHTNDVVHRDIKPSNIMLSKEKQVKVTDFGVARVVSTSRTETGVVLGTPSYMSPEQVAGKKVDGRSDLFSLGVVLYELFSCEKPFAGDSLAALMYNIANGKYTSLEESCPGLPDGCYEIVTRLMSKTLKYRYKSANLLQRDISDLLDELEGR